MDQYNKLFSRNIGFFSEEEQIRLKNSSIFIVGVGGMGGACVQSVVRSGVGKIGIADFDTFELSNINRQIFADTTNVGMEKCKETMNKLKDINPGLKIKTYDINWLDDIDNILSEYEFVINCMDDFKHTISLFRKCREHHKTVIDSYNLSPLPSVFVVQPNDPLPEERLHYVTCQKEDIDRINENDILICKLKEIEYILTYSSAINYVDLTTAEQVIKGERPRFSFSAMVSLSGNLMAYEAVFRILGKQYGTDYKGYFFNPYTCAVEKEKFSLKTWFKKPLVKKFLRPYYTGLK